MAASPLESKDVEQPASGEDDTDMNPRDDGAGGLGDFEVKEQDRWLPIANGWSPSFSYVSLQNESFTRLIEPLTRRCICLTAHRLRNTHRKRVASRWRNTPSSTCVVCISLI